MVAAYFILRVRDTHIDFLRLLFVVSVICPLIQEHSLPLKKLISQAPEDAMLKIRPVYKRLFKINRVLRADQKSDVNQTCQQSVFSPIGACIRIWSNGAPDWCGIGEVDWCLPINCKSILIIPFLFARNCGKEFFWTQKWRPYIQILTPLSKQVFLNWSGWECRVYYAIRKSKRFLQWRQDKICS